MQGRPGFVERTPVGKAELRVSWHSASLSARSLAALRVPYPPVGLPALRPVCPPRAARRIRAGHVRAVARMGYTLGKMSLSSEEPSFVRNRS